jgi:ABC-type multidrug transport system ATPase subunit
MISIQNISKNFGEVSALKDINLEIEDGELFGLIGPDGAGKTTLFRIINTLLIPDAGTASVFDFDTVDDYKIIRPMLGYMPGRFSLYMELSVEENIRFFASVFGTTLEENYELIKPIYQQLEPFKNRYAGALSGGMKQKLALSCALIHKPKLLLLDEPTTGVDAVSRKEFWEMLKTLKKEGITIIVSTPYMDEAKLCDRVALIQKGEILQINQPQKIVQSFGRKLYGIQSESRYKLLQVLQDYEYSRSVHPFGEKLHYTDQRDELSIQELKKYLHDHQLEDAEIEAIEPDIEDVFMERMTGREEVKHE